jgi:hypothetical protein
LGCPGHAASPCNAGYAEFGGMQKGAFAKS